ncbi:gp30 [Corynebacterium phage BFK20]|uniref:Gp30 n=1 Tax=Corynebacterium phage BFK20 TaxID=28358 RepID=Q3V5G5_9CAUD|nr:gp30 [Corynebacterium phage BFK20]CAJ29713.1 gp30 [Corynebacterium phage BFK20]
MPYTSVESYIEPRGQAPATRSKETIMLNVFTDLETIALTDTAELVACGFVTLDQAVERLTHTLELDTDTITHALDRLVYDMA